MTPEQKRRIDIITKRWRVAEQADNRKISQAIFDIGYLTGIIMYLEQEIELEVTAHREDMERFSGNE